MIKESNQGSQQKLTFISNLGLYSNRICKMCVRPSDTAIFGVVVEVSDSLRSTCLRFKLQHAPGRACPRPPRVVSHYIHTHQVPLYIVRHLPPPFPLPLLPKTSSIFRSAPELTIYQVLVSKFLSYGYLLSFTF